MRDIISFLAASIAVLAAFSAIRAYGAVYWPKKNDCHSWFAHGICMVFTAGAANAIYWGILPVGLRLSGTDERAVAAASLGAFANVILKAVVLAWAAFAHLKAKHLSLSARDRREWSILEMIFHPRKTLLRTLSRRNRPGAGSS